MHPCLLLTFLHWSVTLTSSTFSHEQYTSYSGGYHLGPWWIIWIPRRLPLLTRVLLGCQCVWCINIHCLLFYRLFCCLSNKSQPHTVYQFSSSGKPCLESNIYCSKTNMPCWYSISLQIIVIPSGKFYKVSVL